MFYYMNQLLVLLHGFLIERNSLLHYHSGNKISAHRIHDNKNLGLLVLYGLLLIIVLKIEANVKIKKRIII